MRKVFSTLLVLLLVAATLFALTQCLPANKPPDAAVKLPAAATPATPPAVISPALTPAPEPPAVVKPPPWAPAPLPPKMEKIVKLNRADWSGIYVLPAGVTWRNVIEVYHNGKLVPPDRYCWTHPDEIDIFDARLESVMTARILQ